MRTWILRNQTAHCSWKPHDKTFLLDSQVLSAWPCGKSDKTKQKTAGVQRKGGSSDQWLPVQQSSHICVQHSEPPQSLCSTLNPPNPSRCLKNFVSFLEQLQHCITLWACPLPYSITSTKISTSFQYMGRMEFYRLFFETCHSLNICVSFSQKGHLSLLKSWLLSPR